MKREKLDGQRSKFKDQLFKGPSAEKLTDKGKAKGSKASVASKASKQVWSLIFDFWSLILDTLQEAKEGGKEDEGKDGKAVAKIPEVIDGDCGWKMKRLFYKPLVIMKSFVITAHRCAYCVHCLDWIDIFFCLNVSGKCLGYIISSRVVPVSMKIRRQWK